MNTRATRVAVLLADIVASREAEDLRQRRDAALGRLGRRHLEDGTVAFPWTVTTWDEFQGVVPDPARVPAAILDLRIELRPLDLRLGVGFGDVRSLPAAGEPLNVAGSGEAFERARRALDSLAGAGAPPLLTAFATGDEEVDRIANLVYSLHDALLGRLTSRQWETVVAVLEAGRQDRAAERLGVDVSTVSRTLRRASFRRLLDTREAMGRFLGSHLGD